MPEINMPWKRIIVAKALGVGPQVIDPAIIEIHGDVPDLGNNLHKLGAFYEEQGRLIVDVLMSHLPGGTVDQVIMELLKRRASMFRVPFADKQRRR